MIKRIKGSLFAKVFILTVAVLLCVSFLVYGVLAWYMPQTYSNNLNAALDEQTSDFIYELEHIRMQDSGGLFDQFLQNTTISMVELYTADGVLVETPSNQNSFNDVVVKAGLLKASDSKVLSVVFVYLVMPCVVLNAFQIDDTPQIRTGLLYSMGIAVGMHVVFLVLNAIFKRPLKLDVVEQVNIIYSNAAALVIPLVQALLGEEYVVYSCAFVIVQLILLWTHASACLQEGAKLEWKKILTNVNLIAIVAGALLYLLHISLPSPIVSTLSNVGAMIGPMGMLLAGMAIAEVPLKKVFCTPRNYLPVALRLIVVPIIVLLLLRVFHASDWIADGKAILMTVYLSAITPSCATVTSMAQLYNRDAAHSSALYVLSTLLSIMTMPLMIGLFDMLV